MIAMDTDLTVTGIRPNVGTHEAPISQAPEGAGSTALHAQSDQSEQPAAIIGSLSASIADTNLHNRIASGDHSGRALGYNTGGDEACQIGLALVKRPSFPVTTLSTSGAL